MNLWSAVFILCVYLQLMKNLQNKAIKIGCNQILGVDQFMILITRIMDDTDTFSVFYIVVKPYIQ